MRHKLKDVLYYLQGNIRYQIFYSKFAFLIREHIREQIQARINSMNQECFTSGSCIKCGCNTTHLQMCNKACEGDCYPKMLDKEEWITMKDHFFIYTSEQKVWIYDKENIKFIKVL